MYKNKYRVETIRLKNYDYSQPGAYFITIVTHNRQCLFGEIVNGKMQLNEYGKIAQQCWLDIPKHFPHAKLDEFIVMPNHIHGIIVLNEINDSNIVNGNVRNGDIDIVVVETQNFVVETQNFVSLQKQSQNSFQHIIPRSIGSIVRGFKIGVTKWFRQQTNFYTVWQRNYYEHIIRNDGELNRIRQYIVDNPSKWERDENYKRR